MTSFHHQPEAQHPIFSYQQERRPITPSIGTKRTSQPSRLMSAIGGKADMAPTGRDVAFSNRPFEVKHFQTIHHRSVDVAHGLALLFGIGTKALPAWDSKTRWNNLMSGVAIKRQVQGDMRTHLIRRPVRDIFPPQGGARVSSYRV